MRKGKDDAGVVKSMQLYIGSNRPDELVERKKDKQHGFKLIYGSPLLDESAQEIYGWWLDQEVKRHAAQKA